MEPSQLQLFLPDGSAGGLCNIFKACCADRACCSVGFAFSRSCNTLMARARFSCLTRASANTSRALLVLLLPSSNAFSASRMDLYRPLV